jgi:hypothetical protein
MAVMVSSRQRRSTTLTDKRVRSAHLLELEFTNARHNTLLSVGLTLEECSKSGLLRVLHLVQGFVELDERDSAGLCVCVCVCVCECVCVRARARACATM